MSKLKLLAHHSLSLPAVQRWNDIIHLPLSAGELHFLWAFMDGSIMIPETRQRLRRAWGMCARHSIAWLLLETAFRPNFLHGPALLYEDIMGQAVRALQLQGPGQKLRLARRLREQGPCLMCELGYGPTSVGYPPAFVTNQGKKNEPLRTFLQATAPWWQSAICGTCSGNQSTARCRIHLRQELLHGTCDLEQQRALVNAIDEHIANFSRSFRWEFRGTDTIADRAGLIAAMGWCSGWEAILAVSNTTG